MANGRSRLEVVGKERGEREGAAAAHGVHQIGIQRTKEAAIARSIEMVTGAEYFANTTSRFSTEETRQNSKMEQEAKL